MKEDILEKAVNSVKETRIARGKVDDVYVFVVVTPFSRRKINGYEVIVHANEGLKGQKVRQEFFEKEEAYKYFEMLVVKHGLKEVDE